MMLGVNLENTTSSDFRVTATARYLAFDIVGSGSELRVDGTIGSDPSIAIELYRPIGPTPLFIAPYAGVGTETFNLIEDDAVIARYKQTVGRVGLQAGVNLGARSDVRIGAYRRAHDRLDRGGDPGFPELRGKETGAELRWRVDTQDSPVVPSGGWLSQVQLSRIFDSPDIAVGDQTFDVESSLTQLSGCGESLLEHRPAQSRVRVWGFGTSFDSVPLPTNQFALGTPFRLGAYQRGRAPGRSLLRRNRRVSAASGSASRLHGRTGIRGRMARERGCLRRVGARRRENERRCRPGDGHHRRPGCCGRLVELRRTLAHISRYRPRRSADVPWQ